MRGGIGGRWPAGALGALARGLDAHPCRGDPSSPKSHLQSPGRRPLVLWSARVSFLSGCYGAAVSVQWSVVATQWSRCSCFAWPWFLAAGFHSTTSQLTFNQQGPGDLRESREKKEERSHIVFLPSPTSSLIRSCPKARNRRSSPLVPPLAHALNGVSVAAASDHLQLHHAAASP